MGSYKLCQEFPDVFNPELGKLKELQVKFKAEAKPMFCKLRTVPFAHEEDLAQAYDAGIKHGVWRKTQFNECGTPVVPIWKPLLSGQAKAKLRVCGDYSATVNTGIGNASSSNTYTRKTDAEASRRHLCPEMHATTKMADLAKELHN